MDELWLLYSNCNTEFSIRGKLVRCDATRDNAAASHTYVRTYSAETCEIQTLEIYNTYAEVSRLIGIANFDVYDAERSVCGRDRR